MGTVETGWEQGDAGELRDAGVTRRQSSRRAAGEGPRTYTEPRARKGPNEKLADFLGWFSVGLGVSQIVMPRVVSKICGIDDSDGNTVLMRALGMRELTSGVGILTQKHPTNWVWSRVAGDALDLSLLVLTALRNPDRRARTAFAAANVLAVAAPDVSESVRLSRRTGDAKRGKLVRKAVTLAATRVDVEAAWLGAEQIRRKIERAGANVSFRDAPGERGTELLVEWIDAPPGDDLGRVAKKVAGRDLATQLSDDLRRFKQRVETGDVTRSDATPMGHRLGAHAKQRPAQPLEEAKR